VATPAFGVTLPRGRAGFLAFRGALQSHMDDAATIAIPGTYRWNSEVTHFYNPNTGLNVIRDESMNFVSGWKLSPQQTKDLLELNNVW
jgi:hypothetical protein